jgi:polar amino acid transport system permease protein
VDREWSLLWDHRDEIAAGFGNTVLLTLLAAAGALALGCLVALLLASRRRPIRVPARAFVQVMRCVPFLVFAYLIYYGLPSWGFRADSWTSGLIALLLYHAAYMADGLWVGWRSLPEESVEAGHAFGFSGLRLLRRVILPPVLLAAGPIFGNQLIQIVRDSSFLTIIAVPELTHVANAIQSNYYIPFSTFAVAVVLYWALSGTIELGVGALVRVAEARR